MPEPTEMSKTKAWVEEPTSPIANRLQESRGRMGMASEEETVAKRRTTVVRLGRAKSWEYWGGVFQHKTEGPAIVADIPRFFRYLAARQHSYVPKPILPRCGWRLDVVSILASA